MTIDDIETDICDRLGLTSPADKARVNRTINRKHREITSALGIRQSARRTTTTALATIGLGTVTFTSAEKVIAVYNRNVTPYTPLQEVTLDELRDEMPFTSSDRPTRWAMQSATATTVTILLDTLAATGFTLHADVYAPAATLSGTDVPAFSESYHDILVDLVLVGEYLKIEKSDLARIAKENVYGPVGRPEEGRMAQLRHWYAVSTTKEMYQGKTQQTRGIRRNNMMV